jgi:hypothetical protein
LGTIRYDKSDQACNVNFKLKWSASVGSSVYATPVIFPAGAEGKKQIYMSTYYKYVEVLGYDGFKPWGWPISFEDSSFQGSPIARPIDFTSSCDIAKRTLTENYVPYKNVAAPAGTMASIKIGDKEIPSLTATLNDKRDAFSPESAKAIAEFKKAVIEAAKAAGLTAKADPAGMNMLMVMVVLVYLVILVTMVYGPIAAMLVEMFPTRIRYTSMSLPYHIGNGWFGGLLPTTAFAMVAATGDIFYGLWYPVIVAAGTFVIGMLFIKETKDVDIFAND